MKKIIWLITILTTYLTCYGQDKITGTIYDENGNYIPNVFVIVKETQNCTLSDSLGRYTIVLPKEKEVLIFQKQGYKSIEVNSTKYTGDILMQNLDIDITKLSIDELLTIKVVTASNFEESLFDAPATIIVISASDIEERGYSSISEIFSDLPGMDISRHFGDPSVYNYWRGYRTAYAQPYILMIDGMSCNDIFYNQPQIIDNLPILNIERIEVVYGPASVVYGANAFMGIINIITKKAIGVNNVSFKSVSRISPNGDFNTELLTKYSNGDFSTSLSLRSEFSDIANKVDLNYAYTDKKLLEDSLLWGTVATNQNIKYPFELPNSGQSVDFRIGYKDSEIGVHVNTLSKGWGIHTPFDRYMPKYTFKREFYYLWALQNYPLSKQLVFHTKLCYQKETRKKGDWMEAYNVTNNGDEYIYFEDDSLQPGATIRIIDYSYWPLKNDKLSFQQYLTYLPVNDLSLVAGVQFSQSNITRQQGFYGNAYSVKGVDIDDLGFYPEGEDIAFRPSNKIVWNEYGFFSLLKYTYANEHTINLGARIDNHSEYKSITNFRSGYVFSRKKLTIKTLYGQAYQVPSPRTLYSIKTFAGSSLDLKPEKSETVELNVNYSLKELSAWISTYYIYNKNTIVFYGGNASNLGSRKVVGIDGYVNAFIPVNFMNESKIWCYFSTYLISEENIFDDNGLKTGISGIGDLSKYKFYFGTTNHISKHFILNLRGRYKSPRIAVKTNITSRGNVRTIDGYFTLDGNLVYKNLFLDGLDISLKVDNVLNTVYYHPGINWADAGTESGYWNQDNTWVGSRGWFNSVLPQPHRYVMFNITLKM